MTSPVSPFLVWFQWFPVDAYSYIHLRICRPKTLTMSSTDSLPEPGGIISYFTVIHHDDDDYYPSIQITGRDSPLGDESVLNADALSELDNTIQTVSASNANITSESEIHDASRRSQKVDVWLKFSTSSPTIKSSVYF